MNNETQQTAIDIAFEKLANSGLLVTRDYKNLVAYWEAKEMEKGKIQRAFEDGVDNEYEHHINNLPRKNSQQYYNEEYGGNK